MTETIALIDYGSGNLRSVEKALEAALDRSGANARVALTNEATTIKQASRIVLPGVGAFAACMDGLSACPGVIDALHEAIIEKERPFLGICVGMQLLATLGLEFGSTKGLDWIPGMVKAIEPKDPELTIPNMGWREVQTTSNSHPVMGNANGAWFYFAHSYYFDPETEQSQIATFHYGEPLTAAVAKHNIIGLQFHPEKSQLAGLNTLTEFIKWMP